ncbi:MAG: hypothetical protein GVY19_08695 [Bacteroidetes bacterium]|nr:hypothetical protein [Bacteroidota bacterium]
MSLALLWVIGLHAQSDLDMLSEMVEPETQYAQATFKSTRILNGHSIEQTHEGELSFRISHRFGPVNQGVYELFGIDQAIIHFSLEYGIAPWLMVGVGRSSFDKTYDGFVKARIFRQAKGENSFPVSVNYMGASEIKTVRSNFDNYLTRHRLAYIHQLLIARKFNNALSMQVSPTYLHRNIVPNESFDNDLWSLGVGGRLKITPMVTLNAEVFLVDQTKVEAQENYYIPVAFGVDIETGGHVFQLMVTNAQSMREGGFIGQTTGNWLEGDLHFGFNISRVFNIVDQ